MRTLLLFSCLLLGSSDQSENCGSWAAAGECGRNPAYMLKAAFSCLLRMNFLLLSPRSSVKEGI